MKFKVIRDGTEKKKKSKYTFKELLDNPMQLRILLEGARYPKGCVKIDQERGYISFNRQFGYCLEKVGRSKPLDEVEDEIMDSARKWEKITNVPNLQKKLKELREKREKDPNFLNKRQYKMEIEMVKHEIDREKESE